MTENTAATEIANTENSDQLTKEEESQLHGETEVKTQEKSEEKKDKKDTVVPYSALHEERMRRKEMQKEMQELRQKSETGEKRLQELLEKFKPQPPKFEENPAAHLKHEVDSVRSELAESRRHREEQEASRKAQEKEREFVENYRSQAEVFASGTPDFNAAYEFVMKTRHDELKALGYKPEKIRQMIFNEERMIVEDAFSEEVNPAERIYALAKARGYAKEETEAEKQIKTVQKGLESSQTLKGGGTSSGLTIKSLAEMSEEEFSKIDEATFRKLAGG